jgi:hypothetical protein
MNSGAPKLTISIDVELARDPRKYTNSGQERPTERKIIVREQLLEYEFVTNNLNIQKSNICLEFHIEKDVIINQDSYTCKKCKDRNAPNHFTKNNMHPLWYEIEEDGSFRTDSNGKKIPQFDRPHELLRLSMAEKPLIQRCASFVPSIHLSNGTFALKGHCVTFPQDITKMCNKLPLRKEAVVLFICYIGNKDTSAVYPKSLRFNKQNVLKVLLWLIKHNPHYADITIYEANLDWMNGKNEANIGTQATILKTKDTQCYKINTAEEEVVSNYHKPFEINDLNDDCCDMDIGCMHANENNSLPTGMDAEIMKSFVEIAKKTGRSSEIMEFPPINHDSPIRYELLYT